MPLVPRWRPLLAPAVLALAALPLACRSCKPPDDRARIERLLQEASEATEARDAEALFAATSPEFVGKPGELDRVTARALVRDALRAYGKLTLHRPDAQIELDVPAGEAWVRTPFVLLKPGGPFTVPDVLRAKPLKWLERASQHVDPYHLELWLTRSSRGEWTVQQARLWGPAGPPG